MTPWCSCVVRAGILLTREPLGEVFQAVWGWCSVTARRDSSREEKEGSARGPRIKVGGGGGGSEGLLI